jgi:HlyD family secretion protein
MITKTNVLTGLAILAAGVGYAAATGHLPMRKASPAANAAEERPSAPAVSVVKSVTSDFIDTVLVNGSVVARDEILVGAEVEGLRVVEVLADEGDRVKKGQVLARLTADTLAAQAAQNDASLARALAGIAQARSNITSAEAKREEAQNAYNRGKPLRGSGYLSESVQDQREAAAKTADAQLASSKDGLRLAEADKNLVEAQRKELDWKRSRTDINAPADGLISRRIARVGTFGTGAADPMFRIVAKGETELDAEVVEMRLAKIKIGQTVRVEVNGATEVTGQVRLVSSEIDKATRLGKVRIFIGDRPDVRVGAFARGLIETGRSRGVSVPVSAVLFNGETAAVQAVRDGRVVTQPVKTGLIADGRVEIREGLKEGELVVSKSGTFVRDGDAVRPIPEVAKTSEVK